MRFDMRSFVVRRLCVYIHILHNYSVCVFVCKIGLAWLGLEKVRVCVGGCVCAKFGLMVQCVLVLVCFVCSVLCVWVFAVALICVLRRRENNHVHVPSTWLVQYKRCTVACIIDCKRTLFPHFSWLPYSLSAQAAVSGEENWRLNYYTVL